MNQDLISEAQEIEAQFPEVLKAWANSSELFKKAAAITICKIAKGEISATA